MLPGNGRCDCEGDYSGDLFKAQIQAAHGAMTPPHDSEFGGDWSGLYVGRIAYYLYRLTVETIRFVEEETEV